MKKGSSKGIFSTTRPHIFEDFFFQDQLNAKKFMECSNRVNYHHKLTNLPMTIIDIPLCPSSVPKNLFGVSCTNGQQTTENNIPQNFFFAVHKSLGYFFYPLSINKNPIKSKTETLCRRTKKCFSKKIFYIA